MKLLLDTCCIIWAVSEPTAISQNAVKLLTAEKSEISVSAISVAELACSVERGRVIIDRHWKKWFRHYIDLNGWQVESVSLEIMEEAYSLPDNFHADPADRIITATARIKKYTILTADKKILAYPHVNSIW
ncbi:type II toxin-antitoxin system VapC family toxin [Desulfosarcina variabilis]|uniref:type II toxin-antitoxin system VapC family toxin n=1 Tax=Desulfosarcina variabilis TaxID=2300 RepID=UPI003AFA4FCC